jgi:hypothetical protein
MPKAYTKMKAALKREGKSDKVAKRISAATFNSRRKPGQKPVTRYGK